MKKVKLTIWSIVFATLAGVSSFSVYRYFGPGFDDRVLSQPSTIGRVGQIDLKVFVGNVAVPSRMRPSAEGRWTFNPELGFWEAFLVTAPTPELVQRDDKAEWVIPWTMLPGSVADSVHSIDPELGANFARWLGLAEGRDTGVFGRISKFAVDPESRYGSVTSVRSIYAVDLFDYLEDWGPAYKENLSSAISAAVKEVVEKVGKNDEKEIAIPAIAGAHYVVENELVLTYRDSFSAIIDGVGRAGGGTPSAVILVVWNGLIGHAEFNAALEGLRFAALEHVPAWRSKLVLIATGSVATSLILGVIVSHRLSQRKARKVAMFFGVATVFAATVGSQYVEWLGGILPLSNWPSIEIGLYAFVSVIIGTVLHQGGMASIEDSAAPS